jgi:hypothetical protein
LREDWNSEEGKMLNAIRSAHFENVPSEFSVSEEEKKDLRITITFLSQEEHRKHYMGTCGNV